MAEHRIEFVQFFHTMKQGGKVLLEVLDGDLVFLRHPLLFFDVDVGQFRDVDHQVFPLGQELMERRIDGANDNGEAGHSFEQSGKILALQGQQLGKSLAPSLLVARENHLLHVLDAVFGKEHMFRAAKADALGSKGAGGLGVAGDVGVGADTEAAAELIGPLHQFSEVGRVGVWLVGLSLA